MTESQDAQRRLAEASRIARRELDKQGTPDYDHRAHERAVEAERKAAEAARAARGAQTR
ncbi:translation initiation factor 2 [Cellulomonas sp. JZ18]|uniref:translation initiation factor 2 n=1 Tax=Cellulomonas sp. JZ18 TaxID=2654191 RepID=UPI0012D3DD74|nr:translation initiation factor 2 [Cellulomonas sp. JZ18]QGQ19507.1 translation initiation factor 2 [Cellulomonas sp. JZ18]